MPEIFTSTKALSVFNVLAFTRQDLSRGRIEEFLREAFDQNLEDGYVDNGVTYLLEQNLATEVDGLLKIQRQTDGRAKPIVRSADGRELVRASY